MEKTRRYHDKQEQKNTKYKIRKLRIQQVKKKKKDKDMKGEERADK